MQLLMSMFTIYSSVVSSTYYKKNKLIRNVFIYTIMRPHVYEFTEPLATKLTKHNATSVKGSRSRVTSLLYDSVF